MLILPIAGLIIGGNLDEANKKSLEREIEKIKRETEIKKLDAEENLRIKIVKFMGKSSLIDVKIEQPPPPAPAESVLLPESCPRCDSKLPPPFQASNRIVCGKCGWSNKQKKS